MQAVAYPQGKVFEAALQFARTQGTIPAPETAHAIRAVIDEALAAKERVEEKVILFGYSGHGLLDLGRLRRLPPRKARRRLRLAQSRSNLDVRAWKPSICTKGLDIMTPS